MSSAISHSIKKRITPKDVFYTPFAVVKTQLTQIKHLPTDSWLDPFYGKGIYFNNFPTDKKEYTEIELGKDFFEYSGKPSIIVSNPPYSILDKVIEKTLELKPRIFSYLLLHGAMTPKRMELIKARGYGLTSIYTCKVFKWYGMAEAYTFEYGSDWEHCKIIFDRIVHHSDANSVT